MAKQIYNIVQLTTAFRTAARCDATAGVRQVFKEARETGQSALSGLTRPIPRQAPVLVTDDSIQVVGKKPSLR